MRSSPPRRDGAPPEHAQRPSASVRPRAPCPADSAARCARAAGPPRRLVDGRRPHRRQGRSRARVGGRATHTAKPSVLIRAPLRSLRVLQAYGCRCFHLHPLRLPARHLPLALEGLPRRERHRRPLPRRRIDARRDGAHQPALSRRGPRAWPRGEGTHATAVRMACRVFCLVDQLLRCRSALLSIPLVRGDFGVCATLCRCGWDTHTRGGSHARARRRSAARGVTSTIQHTTYYARLCQVGHPLLPHPHP